MIISEVFYVDYIKPVDMYLYKHCLERQCWANQAAL